MHLHNVQNHPELFKDSYLHTLALQAFENVLNICTGRVKVTVDRSALYVSYEHKEEGYLMSILLKEEVIQFFVGYQIPCWTRCLTVAEVACRFNEKNVLTIEATETTASKTTPPTMRKIINILPPVANQWGGPAPLAQGDQFLKCIQIIARLFIDGARPAQNVA